MFSRHRREVRFTSGNKKRTIIRVNTKCEQKFAHGMTSPISGAALKEWREKTGLTQEELGQRLGVTREWIGKLETSERPISANIYLKLETLKREHDFASRHQPEGLVVEKAPTPHGALDAIRTEILQLVTETIRLAGDDFGKLGWIREEAIRHLSPPDHWDMHARAIRQAMAERSQRGLGEDQRPDAQGKAI